MSNSKHTKRAVKANVPPQIPSLEEASLFQIVNEHVLTSGQEEETIRPGDR